VELKELPTNRAVVLRNITCPYCGKEFGASNPTREHLVGRRFVPKGRLNQNWNLILNACAPCNNYKSELEDDLSAITMQSDAFGRYAAADQNLQMEAARKGAKSVSRSTGKPIDQSRESFTIEGSPMPGVQVRFGLTGLPRAEPERVFELARLQLAGLFYWITFSSDQRKGGFWVGGSFGLQYTFRADWGNDLNRAFMNEVFRWEDRLFVGTADGYFKAAIRRHPVESCWSWALEWNKNLRVTGFFGDEITALRVLKNFPRLEYTEIRSNDAIWRHREEVSLAEDEDVLFCPRDETAKRSAGRAD
jgi:hypothetical protein